MQGDQIRLVARDAFQLTITVGHVTMRRAMKAIAPDAVTAVELIGDRVQIRRLGQSLMKGSIENCDLRESGAKHLARSEYAFDIRRIVERRELHAIFNGLQHLIADQHRLLEVFSPMDHAVPDCMDVGNTFDLTGTTFGTGPTQNQLDRRSRVSQSCS